MPVGARPAADQMTDVVVVGSNPGALAAALACRREGLEVLVVEASGLIGGPEALGAGQLWAPGLTQNDDYATARDYFDRVVGDPEPASSAPRRHAFLTGTAPLAGWLAELGVGLHPDQVGDHYPQIPGGRGEGRVLAPEPADATVIGQLASVVPDGQQNDASGLVDRLENGARLVGDLARGRRIVYGGASVVVGLLAACQRAQVNLWWDAPVRVLLTSSPDGRPQRVTGALVQRGGRLVRVFAGRGVILAQGGFEADATMRRKYLPTPSRPAWTLGQGRDDGVRQLAWAEELGLQVAGLGAAWWRPGLWDPSGRVWDAGPALAAPHGFMVDATGRRFTNEAGAGNDICRAWYARAREFGPEMVAWLVLDAAHRHRGRLGDLPPGRVSRNAEKSGWLVSGRTLPELAWRIKVDAAGLQATAERFDGFAERGVDDDLGRGNSVADRARGDRTHRPNPCLGAVHRGPFHAVRVVPADLGTKGGLLTDEYARVMREDGPMPGLWAIGSSAASVTGVSDPAPGVGHAEAMVMGRAAAASISRTS